MYFELPGESFWLRKHWVAMALGLSGVEWLLVMTVVQFSHEV